MHSSTLIKLLNKFNKEEWKRFDKFIRSPYFNSNKSVIQLFELLRKYAPDFATPKLNKEKVSQKIYPKTPYKEKRMWQLMSDLKGLAEQFLVVEKNDKYSTKFQIQLSEVFLEKDLHDWYEQKSEVLIEKLTADHHLASQFQLHQIYDTSYYNNHSKPPQATSPNLVATNTHLEYYFYLQQLRYACEWLSRSKRIVEDLPLFVQSINYRAQHENKPLYVLYYRVFLLFFKEDKDLLYFKNLIQKLKVHIQEIPKKHQIALLLYLINYGGKKIQSSEDAYIPILFELYQLGFENKRLIYKDTLSETSFMNTVSIACQSKALDWAQRFIQDFHQYLPKEEVATTLTWAKALISMEEEAYPKAVQLINEISFNTEIKEITRRSVELRACLGCIVNGDYSYYELLRNKSLSFEKYLQRKKGITINKKTVFFKTNRVIRKLAKLIYENTPTYKLNEFYKEIQETEDLAVKNWFLSQIQIIKIGRINREIPSPKKVIKLESNLHR